MDPWTVQATIGLYRVANASGNTTRADSLLNVAIREARRIGDRGGELDALIGLSGTRASSGPDEPALSTLDSLRRILPPGDSWERGEYLCRLGLFRGVGGDTGVTTLIRDGIAVAERVGERQLAGHCLEALALVHSLHGKPDSVFPIMARAETLLRATNAHASLARLYSRRSDELQARGRLGEAKIALGQVLAEATLSRNGNRLANAYGGLGMLALRTGDLPSAADWYERAAVLHDSLGDGEGGMISRQNRAEVLAASGDLGSAKTALTATLAEAEKFGFFEDAVIARQRLARLAMRRGDWAEAEQQLAAAEAKARGRGMPGVAENLVYDRGVLALGTGRLDEAERLFGGFVAKVAPEDRLVRHAARVRLAEVAARKGELARAEREITAASRELEEWRASLGDDELRGYAFSATVLGEYDAQAPTARVLAALAAGHRAEAAFALAEQRRARLLTDRLNQALALREGSATDTAVVASTRAHPLTSEEITAGAAGQRDRGAGVRRRQRGRAHHALRPQSGGRARRRAAERGHVGTGDSAAGRDGGERGAPRRAHAEPGRRAARARPHAASRRCHPAGDRTRRPPASSPVRCADSRRRRGRSGAVGDRTRALGQPRRDAMAAGRARGAGPRCRAGCWRWGIRSSRWSSPRRRCATGRPTARRSRRPAGCRD